MTTTPHIEGRPVSRRTFEVHGCRCDGCAADERAHRDRANARRRLFHRIEKWLIEGHPVSAVMDRLGVDYATVKRVERNLIGGA